MTSPQAPTPPPVAPQPAAPNTRWWRTKKARIAITVVVVALIAIGKFSLAEKRQEERATTEAKQEISSYLVGDCVALEANGDDVHRTDCSTDPSFTVGAALDTDQPCMNANYIGYNWALDDHTIGRLCLVENLTAGHCYRPTTTGKNLEQIDCTTTDDKAYKVIQRLDADDPAQCPPDTNAYNYPTPARTYCLASTH